MKKHINWFLNLKRHEFFVYVFFILGIGMIFSSFVDLETKPDDLTTIDGKIDRIYNQEEERLFNYRSIQPKKIRVLLELNEYNTIFVLGEKGNKFSAEIFNYGLLNDRNITLHVKKKDLKKLKNKSYYKPYSAFTETRIILPLDKTLAERNSTRQERLILGIVMLFISLILYFATR
jgi:hypothetical protein